MKIDLKYYINKIKDFWNIIDFKNEIRNWKFELNERYQKTYHIGHPKGTHKGDSVGDILPYTRLPELLKEKYPNSKINIPSHFKPFFKNNPHIDGISDNLQRWGSLGTWGTTVQRTCNVWGIQTFKFTPIIYSDINLRKDNDVLICINSKTGGEIKHIAYFDNIIKQISKDYNCTQLAVNKEYLLKNVNKYIFNLDINNLVNTINKFSYYIGVQNSIYHLSKSLNLKCIGILPENIDPFFVKLPLLTQTNHKELEMLTDKERERSERWKRNIYSIGKNPNDSHHVGWLYPDNSHLTMNLYDETEYCPMVNYDNIIKAIENKIYPYGRSELWDFENYFNLWI